METRVIVADNARARIFASHSTLFKLEEVEGFVHTQARLSNRELVSDASGRSTDRGDTYDAPTSPKEHEERTFAHMLGQHLKDMHNRQHFESLVLVAPPKFLGMLHGELPKPLGKLVARTLDKDLTTCSVEEIIDHILV